MRAQLRHCRLRHYRLRLCCLAVLASLGACTNGRDPELLNRAGALNRAIDALRQAPNPAKRQHLEALGKLPCGGALQCQVKQECSAAYSKHVAALDRMKVAKQGIGRAAEESLAAQLEQVRSQLVLAEKETQSCVTRQAQLRKHYGIER